MKIIRIKNIDGWIIYKPRLLPMIKESLEYGVNNYESINSFCSRIEHFLFEIPENIRIYIALEDNNEIILFTILMIEENEYDKSKKACHIYGMWIKPGNIFRFIKHSKHIIEYAKLMNCNVITCSSLKDWELFCKKYKNVISLDLKRQFAVYEMNL